MAVVRGNHMAIKNERFHRYMNKAFKIPIADLRLVMAWRKTVFFAIYVWNTSPINGTDIIRSSAAIGKKIPFPIDIEMGPIPRIREEGRGQSNVWRVKPPIVKEAVDIVAGNQ